MPTAAPVLADGSAAFDGSAAGGAGSLPGLMMVRLSLSSSLSSAHTDSTAQTDHLTLLLLLQTNFHFHFDFPHSVHH